MPDQTLRDWQDACVKTRVLGGLPIAFSVNAYGDSKINVIAAISCDWRQETFGNGLTVRFSRVLPLQTRASIDDHLFDLAMAVYVHELCEQWNVGDGRPRDPHTDSPKLHWPSPRAHGIVHDLNEGLKAPVITPTEYAQLMAAYASLTPDYLEPT